jgi:hypothetical protein
MARGGHQSQACGRTCYARRSFALKRLPGATIYYYEVRGAGPALLMISRGPTHRGRLTKREL